MPLGSQQPFPAMRQAQPKLTIVFVMRVRSEFSALLGLILEEIGRFEHCDHHNKSPAYRGFDEQETHVADICSERKVRPPGPGRGLARFRNFAFYILRLYK